MKQKIIIIIACMFFLIPVSASADKTDRLIQLLVEKKIVSSEEAKAIMEELDSNEEVKPEVKMTKTDGKSSKKTSSDWTENIEVKYNKGAVIKTVDNNYSLKLNARFQGLFLYTDLYSGQTQSTFMVRRARILASGNAFAPWLKFGTQITLEGDSAFMRDAFIEASRYEKMTARVGQYKVPFDREFLDGGFNLQLINRSIASAEYSLQRDVGLRFSGKKILDHFDYQVGVFNGSGINWRNLDDDYMYVGRLVWSPFKPYPYSQSAVDNPSDPVLSLAFAGAYMPGLDPEERGRLAGRLGNTSIVPVESDVSQWTLDFAYKYQNLSVTSGYHYRNIDPKELTPYGEQDSWGFYIQSGYFIVPERFEVAGRFAFIDPDNPVTISDNKKSEYTLGVNYYLNGHNVKTGLNYSFFSFDKQAGDEDEHLFTTSVILQF